MVQNEQCLELIYLEKSFFQILRPARTTVSYLLIQIIKSFSDDTDGNYTLTGH